MSNIVDIKRQKRREELVSLWVAKFERGLSSEEQRQFEHDILENEPSRELFFAMTRTWDRMDELARLADLFPDVAEKSLVPRSSVRGSSWKALSVAASLLLVAVVIGFQSLIPSAPTYQTITTGYQTDVGETTSVLLPDGSRMMLNTNSQVDLRYEQRLRTLVLKRGELHIEVAHDVGRPLIVKAGDRVFQAVGTAFNVELIQNKGVELTVTEGSVLVGDRAKFESQLNMLDAKAAGIDMEAIASMRLNRGERAMLRIAQESKKVVSMEDIENDLSWRRGKLVFAGESLEQAIAEVSRYTSVEFGFADQSIKDVRIAGLFRANDVNTLLAALRENFDIESRRSEDGKIWLYKSASETQ